MTAPASHAEETTEPARGEGLRPVFVTGVPRSGTTLLAALLAGSATHGCGPETHVLSLLDDGALRRLARDDAWPAAAVETLAGLRGGGIPLLEAFGVERGALARALAAETPSERAIVAALPALHADRQGKPAWIEKTPGHLQHVERIRRLFPEAGVVQIVRDPRDVARSLTRVPWASGSYLANCYLWRRRLVAAQGFFEHDPRAWVVRYEDLVGDPGGALQDLCDQIGIPFRDAMTDPAPAAGLVATAAETWKSGVAEPLTTSRAGAWRREVPPEVAHAAGTICHGLLGALGYEEPPAPRRTHVLTCCDRRFVQENEERIVAAAAAGVRLLPAVRGEEDDAVVSALRVGGGGRLRRALCVLGHAQRALRRRLAGRPVRHVPGLPARGLAERCRRAALHLLGERVDVPGFGAAGGAA